MLLGKYEPFKQPDVRRTFLDYIKAINIPLIDYVAIGVQDTVHQTSTSVMSRQEWQQTFQSLELAQHDPVRKASFNTSIPMFSFDELDYEDSMEKK